MLSLQAIWAAEVEGQPSRRPSQPPRLGCSGEMTQSFPQPSHEYQFMTVFSPPDRTPYTTLRTICWLLFDVHLLHHERDEETQITSRRSLVPLQS
jgi:hypothetical protein